MQLPADMQVVAQSPPWAVDAWGLGCLMQEAFGGQELQRTEDLRNTESIPKPALQVQSFSVMMGGRDRHSAPRVTVVRAMIASA